VCRNRLVSAVLLAVLATSCAPESDRTGNARPDVEWLEYGGAASGTRYSPLADIDRSNVADLRVAWTARAGDFPPEVFDARGHRAGDRREDGAYVEPRAGATCGTCHTLRVRFQATPLMREVAFVTLPAGFRPTDIGVDYLLGIARDALGVERVYRYGLERGGG